MSDVLVIDNSTLRDMAQCTRRAVLRAWHGYQAADESLYLASGRAAHEALAVWLLGRSLETTMGVLHEHYYEIGTDSARVAPDDRLSWFNVERIMRAWFEANPKHVWPYDVVDVEVPFALPLDDVCTECKHADTDHGPAGCTECNCKAFAGTIMFVGRIDARVTLRSTGARYTLEHKTTGAVQAPWLKQFANDAQNSGYLWAQERLTGELYTGAFVNAVELSWAPSDPVRKCKTHGVPYAECGALHPKHNLQPYMRTPEEIASWRVDAVRLAERYWTAVEQFPELAQIGEVPAEGRFHGSCSYCAFREVCIAGARPELVRAVLRHEPWLPFAEVRPGTWQDAAATQAAVLNHDDEIGEPGA